MKYARFIILLGIFIGIVIYLNITGTEEYNKKNKVLDNNVDFSGYIVDIKKSNNHAFGIIQLELIRSSVNTFNDSLENGIYPYRIEGTTAELYTIIPDGINMGDIVSLKSNEKNSHYYHKQSKQKSEGNVWVITNFTDINFVKKHTIFR